MGGKESKKRGSAQGVRGPEVTKAANEEAGRGQELPIAEAWELELEARMWRAEESLKPRVLGLYDKLGGGAC